MSQARIIILTSLTMLAFAGNSLLCRLALRDASIDAASFTTIRLISGAIILWLIIRSRRHDRIQGNWRSALALFAYAATFSFAYISLPAGTGALLLFGAVQASMIGYGLWQGERLVAIQWLGLLLALAGLVGLLLPGLSAPPLLGAVLMLAAGVAWGIYSLLGKQARNSLAATSGNFLRAAPMAVLLSAVMVDTAAVKTEGLLFAVLSGAVTSGLGYAIWYRVLPALKATHAATVQLSVPVIAAVGGILFLGESLDLRLVLATITILGGIALVILEKQKTA